MAKEATDNGQVVEESNLTDLAIFRPRGEGDHIPLPGDPAPATLWPPDASGESGLGLWQGAISHSEGTREGKGIQAWSRYWLSPRSTIEVGYRGARIAKDFLEGGTYQDFGARADLLVRPELSMSGSLQYERWDFPLLSTTQNSNLTASVQLTYWSHWRIR